MALAESIRTQREYAMILDKQGGGIPNKKLKDGDFIAYHVSVGETKKSRQWGGSTNALADFVKREPVAFPEVTLKWLLDFQKFLLGRVSNNTALYYMLTLSYSLTQAEREEVIARNPFTTIRKEDRLKMRTASSRSGKTLPKYLTLFCTLNIPDYFRLTSEGGFLWERHQEFGLPRKSWRSYKRRTETALPRQGDHQFAPMADCMA